MRNNLKICRRSSRCAGSLACLAYASQTGRPRQGLGIYLRPFLFGRDIMWFVYIIYSEKLDKYYTGVTDNLEWRLKRHNQGWGRFTKAGIPWDLVYYEEYLTKKEALKREREIKVRKSRKYIESLISNK
jgi:putative endonuclease